ncbi:DUF5028 domain-containing protein [Gracilibacillus thailandensis]|uniref:DUF5028 domain-containing protein n=1 Tax=Gracilibacillus thailandensis TaxID=563735 RepID=A0A6N7QUX6_9BACI|nr:DUF5028 domain-containing protein [Gracilibacillus thailandensis]MRI65883.1 DUF5028 domain-containing protein [Gracilibacillus thailandensis]
MKKFLILLLCLAFIIGVGIRIWYVNKDVELPPVHTFKMGEEVAIEDNIFLDDFENMDGYTVTVNNAEIISYDAYLAKYEYQDDPDNPLFAEDDFLFPEMVYDVEVTIKNTNKTDNPREHSGINFINYYLIGTDFELQISDQLYRVANPDLETGLTDGFRLRPETEMDFRLPFYFSPSAIVGPIQVKDITSDQVYLVVSLYPIVNQILVES